MKSLIFLHIPKTAGRSFYSVIRRQFKKKFIHEIDNSNVMASVSEFQNLHYSQRANIKCLIGHMPFGLHKFLRQPCGYITFFRDPIDRIISHYYYIRRTPNHYLYNQVVSNKMSLEDYVTSDISLELRNGQTHIITGTPFGDERACGEKLLNIAKENLINHFVFVGLTDRFDESLIMLKRRLGWKNIHYIQQNVTPTRPKVNEIEPSVIAKIKEINQEDIMLYNHAKEIFSNYLKEASESFSQEVERFKMRNALFNVFMGTLLNLPRLIRI